MDIGLFIRTRRSVIFDLSYEIISFCQVTVGTNPISVAAPGKVGDSFVLDMATSSVALGKVSGWEFGRKR